MKKQNIYINMEDELLEKVKEYIEKSDEKIDINKIKSYIYDILSYAIKLEGIEVENVSMSISFASEEEIRSINNEYRKIDKKTDVLSFPVFERDEIINISKEKDSMKLLKEIELGDIILCLNVIYEQSQEYQTGMLRETLYMITHGVCHLLGYDHIEDSDKVIMRNMEEKILGNIGVTRD